jgi:hypothetical protein
MLGIEPFLRLVFKGVPSKIEGSNGLLSVPDMIFLSLSASNLIENKTKF